MRKTGKTERAAQIDLGKLLEQAAAGCQPETNATVAELMDKYAEVADRDLPTRKAHEAYSARGGQHQMPGSLHTARPGTATRT